MLAINTVDIISESTDLGDTVVGSRKDLATPSSAAERAIAILDRVALLDLPGASGSTHVHTDNVYRVKAKTAVVGALMAVPPVTPTARRLNGGRMVY